MTNLRDRLTKLEGELTDRSGRTSAFLAERTRRADPACRVRCDPGACPHRGV